MFRRSVSALSCLFAFVLSSCGPSSHAMVAPPTTATQTPAGGLVQTADATFTFTFPKASSSTKRRPAYLSSATASVSVQVTDTKSHGTSTDIYANVPAALKLVQYFNPVNLSGNPNTPGQCGTDPGNAGNYKCTAKFQMPVGDNSLTIASYSAANGGGSVLSQQILSGGSVLWVQQGVANNFLVSLDAYANAMTIGTTSGFCAGSFTVTNGGSVPTVGTSAVTFNASYTDPAGKTIVAPGLPLLSVNGHTDDNLGSGYTITGTGGNVTVKVNQSTQSYTLQATASGVSATINVSATPHSGTDGLSFNRTLTYTFQAGTAPPPSLLAVIEQTGGASGQIDLFTLNTTTNAFSVNSPSTLSNQGGDVDFPQDILFDTNGDMLIANGGAGNPDFGNFACVPAGAITTGANVATVLTNNMNDPKFIELGTDSSVALGNVPGSSATKTPTFVLSGTYAAAAASRTITNTDYPGLGVTGLVTVPTSATHAAGSYAVTLTNGTTVSHVAVKHPDGTVMQIDDPHLVAPSLGIDVNANPNQLVAASKNGANSYINFFNLLTGALVKQFVIQDTGCYSNGVSPYAGCPPNTASGFSNMKGDVTAVSPSGYVAVAGITNSGEPEVQVYDNTANRAQVGGPIPYDATTTPGGATWSYANTIGSPTIIVHAMRWVTGTKLLVSLETGQANTQGLYLYDVTQLVPQCVAPAVAGTCYDANGNAFPNSPKQVGFQPITHIPLSVAYKP